MKKKTSEIAEPVILGEAATRKELSIRSNEDITDAEIIEDEFWAEENHPNFIESNTSAISLEDLTTKNIIPTFSDNTLTISHQNFIGAVTKVAEQVFVNPEKPDVPLNKNDAFQKVQKRHVQEKR